MDALKMVGLVLIVAGGLALAYGGFSYTKETHTVDLGPLQMQMSEKQRVNVPVWAGLGGIILGGILLVVRRRN